MVVSGFRTVFPLHHDLIIGYALNSWEFFKILGVVFDSKFTFERHICSISSSVTEKISLLRKSFRVFWGSECLTEMF